MASVDEFLELMQPPPEIEEALARMSGTFRTWENGRRAWSRETLLAAARDVAEQVEGPVSVKRFCRLAKVSDGTIARHFPGGWTELRDAVGLQEATRSEAHWTAERLLVEYDRVVALLGRRPTWAELGRLAAASAATFARVLGRKREIEDAYEEFLRAGSREQT